MTEEPRKKVGCGTVLGLCAFALPLLIFFCLAFVVPFFRTAKALAWEETACTVVSAEVVETGKAHRGHTPVYRIAVSFEYEFSGQQFTGSRYDVSVGSTGGLDAKQAIVDELKAQPETVCFVNTSDPSEAVLDRSLPLSAWITGLITLAIVVAVMWVRKRLILGSPGPADDHQ